MFGKPSREPQKPEMEDLQDIKLSPPPISLNAPSQQDTVLQPKSKTATTEESELVNTVEKISLIVSPYFIVVIGLALYENNFLIGTILIAIGILSLLKVSVKDVTVFLEWTKNFFGLGKNDS